MSNRINGTAAKIGVGGAGNCEEHLHSKVTKSSALCCTCTYTRTAL